MTFIKNTQFLHNEADIQTILPTRELVIFIEFHNNWIKIVNCEIFGQSTFLHQSLLFKLYSRMYQNQGDKLPKDIHPIDALKSYGDLNQIKFVQKHEPEKPNNKTNLVQIDSSTKFLAFDVQFLHSQGLRSELVEISACDVQNPDLKFHVSCYAFDEPALKVDPEFQSIQDGLKSFVNWIQNWKCVLIQLNPHKRAWPGFINHSAARNGRVTSC